MFKTEPLLKVSHLQVIYNEIFSIFRNLFFWQNQSIAIQSIFLNKITLHTDIGINTFFVE